MNLRSIASTTIEGCKNLYLFGCEKVIADPSISDGWAHFVENDKGELIEIRANAETIGLIRKAAIQSMNERREQRMK